MSYHQFANETEQFGSFKTFFTEETGEYGWYWQACSPGCLPDGEPMGPFENELEAIADAEYIPQRQPPNFVSKLQNLPTSATTQSTSTDDQT